MSTAEPASLTPILPPELERKIFETAAWEHKGIALQLILVAHRVYIWCLLSPYVRLDHI